MPITIDAETQQRKVKLQGNASWPNCRQPG
jgi:hypothetical protein